MLDINELCAEPDAFLERLADRIENEGQLYEAVELAVFRRTVLGDLDEKKRQRNELSREIAKTDDPGARTQIKDQARRLSEEIKDREKIIRRCEHQMEEALLKIPNIPHDSVPPGKDDCSNREIRRWGQPLDDEPTPLPHWDCGPALGLDVARGANLAGARFYVLRGQLARLEMALAAFMVDLHIEQHGYELVIPPFLVNADAMSGCGQLPKFQNELYCTQDGLYLIPTAESALASLHRGEILSADELPRKYVGYSACFRREAGSAGRDTRGIMRVHQFTKVELFQFTTPERSYDDLEQLVTDAEAVLQALDLPYRVVLLSAGDMGFAAAKTYDLEVWLPSQQTYREISSCSNVEAYQSRRTNTRYRPAPKQKPQHVHMLNGSGLAVGRTMIAILENYQRPDGSVEVPENLRPYLGGLERLVPSVEQDATVA